MLIQVPERHAAVVRVRVSGRVGGDGASERACPLLMCAFMFGFSVAPSLDVKAVGNRVPVAVVGNYPPQLQATQQPEWSHLQVADSPLESGNKCH